ncbi:MAG TPA: MotA/TolQ/ExbB proton channel family protein [Planctomycetota bacterium]
MDALLASLDQLWAQATRIWVAGGWCMPPIALTALAMFALGVHVRRGLGAKGFLSVSETAWRSWIVAPDMRRGPIGELLDSVMGSATLADMATAFREVRATEVAPFARDLRLMRVCISAAPLLGLLGTVTGMLATFQALASGSGGEQTMALVAQGISEALITTETGLVVALPGVFFSYQLGRKFERYQAFLAHLETVCTQHLYRELRRTAAVGRAREPEVTLTPRTVETVGAAAPRGGK